MMYKKNDTGLAELVDECERFMERIESDKVQRSVRDDASPAAQEDVKMQGAAIDDSSEDDDEVEIMLKSSDTKYNTMQVDEVSSKPFGEMVNDDDKLSQLLSADRPEDIGEDSFFETGGLKVQA